MGSSEQIQAERFYTEQALAAECAVLYGDCGDRTIEPRNPAPKSYDLIEGGRPIEIPHGLLYLDESPFEEPSLDGLALRLALDALDSTA